MKGNTVGVLAVLAFTAGIFTGGLVATASPAKVVTEYVTVEPTYAEDDPRWACSVRDDTPCVGRSPIVDWDSDSDHDRCMAALRSVRIEIMLCEPLLTKGDQP